MQVIFSASNLQAAIVLEQTRHFGRAAERLFLSQSAFSQQIAKLEQQVGAKLFERGCHEVGLTAAGQAFLPRARRILEDYSAAIGEARVIGAGDVGEITIGFMAGGPHELTRAFIDAQRHSAPQVTLHFVELSLADQFVQLLNHAVDVAFLRPPSSDPRILMRTLFAEPRVAVLPRSHRLADADELTEADLLDEPFATAAVPAPAEWSGFWSLDRVRGERCRKATDVRTLSESLAACAYLDAIDTWALSSSRSFRHPAIRFVPVRGAYAAFAVAHRRDDERHCVHSLCELVTRVTEQWLGTVEDAVPAATAPAGTPLPRAA